MRHSTAPALSTLRDVLMAAGLGVKVVTTMPTKYELPLLRIERVGGRPENALVDAPRMLISVYAASSVEAEELANRLQDHLELGAWRSTRGRHGHRLFGWRPESVMTNPDPDRPDTHRVQIFGLLRLSRQAL